MSQAHPSMLTLDLAALGRLDPAVQRHLQGCMRCRSMVDASSPTGEPVPEWVHDARPARRPSSFRWLAPVLLAAMAVVGLMVPQFQGPVHEETRAKGQPSFALYLERAGTVQLWDGQQPIVTGDRLQLKVAAAGFDALQVGVAGADGAWRVLYEGAVSPSAETMVPESWLVDDEDLTLTLGFLLCEGGCPANEVAFAAKRTPRDAHQWWSEFTLIRSSR